jgi:hypothetical protein
VFLRRGNRNRTAGRGRHALPPLLEGRVGGINIAILLEAIIRPEASSDVWRNSRRLGNSASSVWETNISHGLSTPAHPPRERARRAGGGWSLSLINRTFICSGSGRRVRRHRPTPQRKAGLQLRGRGSADSRHAHPPSVIRLGCSGSDRPWVRRGRLWLAVGIEELGQGRARRVGGSPVDGVGLVLGAVSRGRHFVCGCCLLRTARGLQLSAVAGDEATGLGSVEFVADSSGCVVGKGVGISLGECQTALRGGTGSGRALCTKTSYPCVSSAVVI